MCVHRCSPFGFDTAGICFVVVVVGSVFASLVCFGSFSSQFCWFSFFRLFWTMLLKHECKREWESTWFKVVLGINPPLCLCVLLRFSFVLPCVFFFFSSLEFFFLYLFFSLWQTRSFWTTSMACHNWMTYSHHTKTKEMWDFGLWTCHLKTCTRITKTLYSETHKMRRKRARISNYEREFFFQTPNKTTRRRRRRWRRRSIPRFFFWWKRESLLWFVIYTLANLSYDASREMQTTTKLDNCWCTQCVCAVLYYLSLCHFALTIVHFIGRHANIVS